MTEKKRYICVQIILILFLSLFFTRISPLVPFDGDDWYFIGAMRAPIPLWGVFNPSKVLPEVLQPLGGYVAAFLVYPFINDYVRAISLVQALVVVSFVMLYLIFFCKYLEKRYSSSKINALISEAFLCMTFFLVFKKDNDMSYYGLWASDLTCYFNYIIPGLLNMTMVFIMDQDIDFEQLYTRWTNRQRSIFWIGIYFSLFSSIQLNIILSGYCSWIIIRDFIHIKRDFLFKYLKSKRLHFFIITIWTISLVYEANGKRAQMLKGSSGSSKFFVQPVSTVLLQIKTLFANFNVMLCILTTVLLLAVFINNTFKKTDLFKSKCNAIVGYIYLLILISTYLVLLYAKTGGIYGSRPDAMWAVISCYLVLLNVSLNIILNNYQKFQVAVPLLLTLTFFVTINQNRSLSSGSYGYDYNTYIKVDNYIIEQIIQGDLSEEDYVEVQVPDEYTDSNWPHPMNMAVWLQNTLYSHKIIRRRIKIVFVPNEAVNTMFYYNAADMEKFVDFER